MGAFLSPQATSKPLMLTSGMSQIMRDSHIEDTYSRPSPSLEEPLLPKKLGEIINQFPDLQNIDDNKLRMPQQLDTEETIDH